MGIYRVKGIKDVKIVDSAGAETDLPYGNTFTMEPEYETFTFEGDGESQDDYAALKLNGTIGGDKLSTDVLAKLYGKTVLTTGLPSGEATRIYMGTNDELAAPQLGLTVDLYAIDDSDESEETLRIQVFKIRTQPMTPPEGQNADKWAPLEFQWSAEKATTDIQGTALPDVPTGGAYYAVSLLS